MPRKIKPPAAENGPADARRLVRTIRSATLASALTGKRTGWPYASLVTVACDVDASPILLLSGLADHTRNLAEDNRASLLFEAASGLANPQTGPRVTLTGRLKKTGDKNLSRRFLARHPGAQMYAGFADFSFYRMTVERAHLVGGFGRAAWFGASKFLLCDDTSKVIESAEIDFVARLNRETGNNMTVLGKALFGGPGKAWQIVSLDPEGCDFRCRNTFRRLDFEKPAKSVAAIRRNLTRLVDKL